jgi:Flp pilus assembly protein TadD
LLGLLAFSGCALVGTAAVQRAGTAAAAGNWVSADSAARRATAWTPWDSEAWRIRAEAALARGDDGQARADLRAAIERDGTNWRLWARLGQLSAGASRARDLARARALNPLAPPP